MNPGNPIANGTLNVIYNADEIITPGGTYSGVAGRIGIGFTGAMGEYIGGDINAGVDFAVSVDNIAVSKDFIMLQEDRNSPADAVFTKYTRNSGLWSLDRNNGNAAKLESTFNYPAIESRDSLPFQFTAGRFESSGIIASDAFFGPGSFVLNVQGHNQTTSGNTSGRTTALSDDGVTPLTGAQFRAAYAEDGQVLIIRPKSNP
jgi:hypothetical protein